MGGNLKETAALTQIEIMKTKNLSFMAALIAGLGSLPIGRVSAQTFTTLHSFTAATGVAANITNSDVASPYSGLILSNNTLYGTAEYGGISGNGTVFRVNTDGTGFTNLHSFAAGSGSFPNVTNSDGTCSGGRFFFFRNNLFWT